MIIARAMAGIFPPATMGLTRWGLVALFLAIILFPDVRQHVAGIRTEWRSLVPFLAVWAWACVALLSILLER